MAKNSYTLQLGKPRPDYSETVPVAPEPAKKEEPEIDYPRLCLYDYPNLGMIPKNGTAIITFKATNVSIDARSEDDPKCSAELEVQSIELLNPAKPKIPGPLDSESAMSDLVDSLDDNDGDE